MAGKMGRQRMGPRFGNNRSIEASGLVKRGFAEVKNGKLVLTLHGKGKLGDRRPAIKPIPKIRELHRIADHLKTMLRVTVQVKDWSDRQGIERAFSEVLGRSISGLHRNQREKMLAEVKRLLKE